jgi:glycerol-3-phosphate dehydrogenase
LKRRDEELHDISEKLFNVCVIGSGAPGAGCALDAQFRGQSAVLLDAADFAGATSSAD